MSGHTKWSPGDYLANHRTIKIEFSFTVDKTVDAQEVADKTADVLCDQETASYVSCDGWEVTDAGV